MTQVDKSPEQLSAEAAAPPVPLAPRLALHRYLSHQETSIVRLHQRDGEPEETDPRRVVRKTNRHGIGATGLPFSHPFERFLSESFGQTFPWSAGMKAVRVECRRSHSDHWERPEWNGSLCYRLVSLVCRYDWSYSAACYELHVDPERTEAVVHRALRRIEQKLTELQARASEVVASDSGRNEWWSAPHEHHVVPGLHESECLQCLRRRAAA